MKVVHTYDVESIELNDNPNANDTSVAIVCNKINIFRNALLVLCSYFGAKFSLNKTEVAQFQDNVIFV